METKLCECGCGNPAPIATQTDRRRGWIKGQPKRFVCGHHPKTSNHNWHSSGRPRKKGCAFGMSTTPEYQAYMDAKMRCTNPEAAGVDWKNYGGRGIEFRFTSFKEFFGHIGPRPVGMSLDRRNSDGHYELGNVRWATMKEQQNNKRNNRKKAA